MIENEMGYRGSKSDFLSLGKSVKEQRVDGSWSNNTSSFYYSLLRCTLMGFERNYQVKIPTKQFKFNNRIEDSLHYLQFNNRR
jgi:hypothetical protein